jgi:hypothetical protein
MRLKADGMEFHQIKEELQRWYNKDKTVTIQQELSTAASDIAGASVGMIA